MTILGGVAFERKKEKYEGLVSGCHREGWNVRFFPVDIGGRGFAGQSHRAYTALAITGERRRRAIYKTEAENSSGGSGTREWIHRRVLLGHMLKLDHLQLGRQSKDVRKSRNT